MKKSLTTKKLLICTILILSLISMPGLQAQDYQITFAGQGESSTVDSVIVENLTQGTILKMEGTDVLHLKGTVSIFNININDEKDKITFSPNPMKDHTKMLFSLPAENETIITLYDLSGKEILKTCDLLSAGEHTYMIKGIREGVYYTNIKAGLFSLSGTLISSASTNGSPGLTYESSTISQEKQIDTKGIFEEKVMQYNTGDRLKLTGKSGTNSTVVTDVPTVNKTIIFEFIACTDGDGNHYPVVFISSSKGMNDNKDINPDTGVQIWMGENLATTKYTDGTIIPLITDGTTWTGMSSHAYCFYDNDPKYKKVYGALYNWYAAVHEKLCPSGFHVPTDAEWTALSEYLGGSSTPVGIKLKETGTTHWHSPNTGATNETGFTALPGGMRTNGYYVDKEYIGRWWSSSEQTAPGKGTDYAEKATSSSEKKGNLVWIRNLDYEFPQLWRGVNEKYYGLSIRCLKD